MFNCKKIPRQELRNLTLLVAVDEGSECRAQVFEWIGTVELAGRDLVGISAPLRNASLGINASVSVIVEAHTLTDALRAKIYTAVTGTGRMIEGFMAEI